MIIPIRCCTCNKVIAHLWNDYCEIVETKKKNGTNEADVTPELLNN